MIMFSQDAADESENATFGDGVVVEDDMTIISGRPKLARKCAPGCIA